MYSFNGIFYVILMFSLKWVICDEYIGNICKLEDTGEDGSCELLEHCQSAQYALKNQNRYPQTCGFHKNSPVVCCVKSSNQDVPQETTPSSVNAPQGAEIPSKNNQRTICKLKNTGKDGYCVPLADCPLVQQVYQTGKGNTQTCGYYKADPIVCCAQPSKDALLEQAPFTSTGLQNGGTLLRNSDQKCQEYGKYVEKVIPLIETSGVLKEVEICDIYTVPITIAGSTSPRRYPHLALIGFDGPNRDKRWLCTGALISEDFVLTAAHCLRANGFGNAKYVRLGDSRNDRPSAGINVTQEFGIRQTLAHPEFKMPSKYNDIGLIQMDRKASLNPYIRPACLPTSNELETSKASATNWGSSDENWTKDTRDLVQYVVDYISEKDCSAYYNKISDKNTIQYDTQLCAKTRGSSKDNCDGETSGGPLQVFNKNVTCSYTLVGVYSYGVLCGTNNAPKVYTRIFPYIDWIEDIVWD